MPVFLFEMFEMTNCKQDDFNRNTDILNKNSMTKISCGIQNILRYNK